MASREDYTEANVQAWVDQNRALVLDWLSRWGFDHTVHYMYFDVFHIRGELREPTVTPGEIRRILTNLKKAS